jgi:hypothetical protein
MGEQSGSIHQPWAITPLGEVLPVDPERWLFKPGAWGEVEATLGIRLPNDYKNLIGDGLACVFDGELVIASPFDPNPNLNLAMGASRSAWALASLRAMDPDWYPISVYPEPGGLLGWGTDGGGGDYHWDTSSAEPDRWTVAVSGRPVFDLYIQRHAVGLSAYLAGLASGEIKPAALGDWPSADAHIERRAS